MAITAKTRAEIVSRIRRGEGRNEIMRAMGVSARTVTTTARAEGLTFDTTRTHAATQAHQAEAKARRAALGSELLGDLERARERFQKAENARDFQAAANGFDALTRGYNTLNKIDPDDGGAAEATGIVGSILAAIKDSVAGEVPLNPIVYPKDQDQTRREQASARRKAEASGPTKREPVPTRV